tara:strand:+ start:88 stop:507 length:420 start_codon:yes stop_codon:yes gene_type:complete
MIIRILNKDDYNQFIPLINEFRPINTNISQELFNNLYDEIFKSSIIYVIEINNILIGTGKLLIEQKFIHNLAKYGRIEDVFIKEDYRNKCIGSKLIQEILNYCKENNFFKITLTCNDNLISFYKNNNFEVYHNNMSQLL